MPHDHYISPFSTRYASKEMQFVFSEDNKFRTWRKLWIALARAEQKQGLDITDEQIAELEAHKDDINYEDAQRRERECRHDVMSHVYAYGLQCPKAAGIIHLGATSCYVGDNTDVILMREGLEIVQRKLLNVMNLLAKFAEKYKAMPCLAYTHLQPAQLTTVGKRATLWLNELYMDYLEVEHRMASLALLGSKGTTGTQASFMELFGGDSAKIKAVEMDIAHAVGFDKVVPVSGQTYSRKMDYFVVSTLSGIAQSASKFSYDMRLLQNFKEMEEPFEKSQIGSSAMPYKRNPMRSERVSSLSRYVMVDTLNTAITAGTQWFERTLDDSANKRIAVAEAFLGVDAILNIMMNVTRRLGGLRQGDSSAGNERAALHGDGEHYDGRGEEGRQPAGTAREAARAFTGGGPRSEGRGRQERPCRSHCGRPGLHGDEGRDRSDSSAGEVYWTQRGAGGRIPDGHHSAAVG